MRGEHTLSPDQDTGWVLRGGYIRLFLLLNKGDCCLPFTWRSPLPLREPLGPSNSYCFPRIFFTLLKEWQTLQVLFVCLILHLFCFETVYHVSRITLNLICRWGLSRTPNLPVSIYQPNMEFQTCATALEFITFMMLFYLISLGWINNTNICTLQARECVERINYVIKKKHTNLLWSGQDVKLGITV